jgi:hypothetical protein
VEKGEGLNLKIELLSAEIASRVPDLAKEGAINRANAIRNLILDHATPSDSKPEKISDEDVWLRTWVAYAQSSNSTESRLATEWADRCLTDFKERFRK